MKAKALVLGGSGAMGVHLVELLAKQDYDVYVNSRKKRCSKENIRFIQGNALELEFLKSLLTEEWGVIVDFMTYTTEGFKSRVKYLCEATDQYVFLSSARVYSNSKSPLKEDSGRLLDTTEDKDYLKTDEYALTKARQENILKNSDYNNWTIIRPYITYSTYRLQLGVLEKEEWLYRALKGRTIVFSKEINTKLTTLTYGLDVAKGIVAIIGDSKCHRNAYHIVNRHSLKWRDVLNIYLSHLEKFLGYKPNVVLQDTKDFFKWKGESYQIKYDRLFNRQFDNSKISNQIDPSEFNSAEDGLAKSLELFLDNPHFKFINWKQEAIKDKQLSEYTSLSEIDGLKQKLKYLIYRFT